MRRLCLILILSAGLLSKSLAQPKPFTLKGKMPAETSGYIYLGYPGVDGTWRTDSCQLKNGVFVFKGNLASKDRGIEFIGVADGDETQDKWRKAVEQDKLPWLQVLKGGDEDAGISRKYNVGSYPTQILIDKQGKIIGRYNETLERLDKMLANIFK